jgi:hypothetical protein
VAKKTNQNENGNNGNENNGSVSIMKIMAKENISGKYHEIIR